jgi:hypothetical protein
MLASLQLLRGVEPIGPVRADELAHGVVLSDQIGDPRETTSLDTSRYRQR